MARLKIPSLKISKLIDLPRYLRIPTLFSVTVGCVSVLLVLVAYFTVQPVVPLFYSLSRPAQHLAAKEWLLLFPLLSFGITFLHTTMLKAFKDYDSLILLLFAWITAVIQVVFLLALVRILSIIT